ncbi:hypothetical protein J1N09_10230 [Aureitalea sp. L0-47]|uniref:hypothetical protein n=1 Tax=Aureitalea sp. L0-47 TaxID=2816962 RepID=UPI002237CC21|nr:hypothetical protein [Aureitalea sp. L0-47]MCW5520216.1 hypothetical protein [Aureitalea sp. L0-47]
MADTPYFCVVQQFLNSSFFIAICALLLACESDNASFTQPEDFIPRDPETIISISNYETLKNDLKLNEIIDRYKDRTEFKLLSGDHEILRHLTIKTKSLISIHSGEGDQKEFAFISRMDSTILELDSVPNIISETLTYGKYTIDRIQVEEQIAFSASRDSFFLLTSSQKLLEEILDDKTASEEKYRNTTRLGSDAELLITRNNSMVHLTDSIYEPLSEQVSLNLTIAPGGITGYGVATGQDSVIKLMDAFKGQIPQTNHISSVHPVNARSSVTFTISNPDSLVQHLRSLRGDTIPKTLPAIFETATELAEIRTKEGDIIIMHSIDPTLTNESLLPSLLVNTNFRDVDIYDFTAAQIFVENFNPLISQTIPAYCFRVEDFFVFTETMVTAENFITSFKTNSVLENSNHYQTALGDMSTASSLMIMFFDEQVNTGISDALFGATPNPNNLASVGDYNLSVLQFSHDRDFAHVNFVCKEATQSKKMAGGVVQLFSKKLEVDILGEPTFFTNHRTGGKDIAVQDMSNKLHLLSSSGKALWSRDLKHPILGEVHEVDILRNGKKQLAFATKNALYVVDRNGNDVRPFPVQFRDEVTQPLSVFDYDNNRKYRFAIVQDKEVLLYDNKGKNVSGFKFAGAGSSIVLPVQHIRMGNKDYILVAEESGTLNILSRVGKSRVRVGKRFKFSDTPIEQEGSSFVVITSEKTKEKISQSGKVSSQKLEVSDSYSFVIDYNTKATLDDNLLRVNGKLIELPFGIYTTPEIYRVNGNTLVSLTETQEKQIFIYNRDGDLLPGFPIYGSSSAALDNLDRSNAMNVLVKGESNEIILYEVR